jgi:kynurenine formamidase
MITESMRKPKNDWYPSKWGPSDEVGALNDVTHREVLLASQLVKKGKVYSLAQTMEYGIPGHPFHGGFTYSTFRNHVESLGLFNAKNIVGAMNVRLEMADHTGTHMDGLNHISIVDRLYNGHKSGEVTGTFGTSRLGVEKTPPIFTRGVLADVAGYKGVSTLEGGYAITENDIRSTLKNEGIALRGGDVLLVATGSDRLWMSNNDKYSGPCPGIGLAAARWIASQGVVMVGADTWNVEVDPCEIKGESEAVHQYLLTKNGIRLIENMRLDELRCDKVSQFLFVCLPLKVKGGTASPVSPIAVV